MLASASFPYVGFIIAQAIVGAVCCWWLARLGQMTLGDRTGLLAAVLPVFFVPHIWWMRHYGEHIFAAAGMVGVLLLLYRADRTGKRRNMVAWGAAIGLPATSAPMSWCRRRCSLSGSSGGGVSEVGGWRCRGR